MTLQVSRRGFLATALAGAGLAREPAGNHERKFAATQFGRIAYLERGRTHLPAAVFLHGFPLNADQWGEAMQLLSTERRCLAPDFMGLGFTDVAPGQAVGPTGQVAMVMEFVNRLRVRTFDLVANDSGGAVAQLIVAKYPSRVRSVLLTNCDTEKDSPPPALLPVIELAKAGKFADEWLAPWLADKKLARSEKGIGGQCYVDPAHPTDRAIESYFTPVLASKRRKDLIHQYALGLEPNALAGIAPALRAYKGPARIVWGTGDTIFSPASPGELDRTFGNSHGVRLLPGRKLFWPEELPGVVAEEARNLWGKK
jgi:haloalkane dehalogenase